MPSPEPRNGPEATGLFGSRRRGGIGPLVARAQARVRVVGVLIPGTADDPLFRPAMAHPTGMGQLGWTIGCNVRIETRWAVGTADIVDMSPNW